MSFKPISINNYIRIHLMNNPSANEKDLRKRLTVALSDYKKGIKCGCGNDIWVVGSASVGNNCFTCITGESYPNEEYELKSSIQKNRSNSDNNIGYAPFEINGYYDGDGNKINMDTIPKPSLCISCINNDDPKEEVLCNLTRHDQKDRKEFKCFAYISMNPCK